jgi:hypothetical protein
MVLKAHTVIISETSAVQQQLMFTLSSTPMMEADTHSEMLKCNSVLTQPVDREVFLALRASDTCHGLARESVTWNLSLDRVWFNCAPSHALLSLADGLWCAAVRLHWLLVTEVILASEEDCRKVDLAFVPTESRSDRTRQPFLQDLAWNGITTVYPMLLAYCKIRRQCFPCV